MVAIADLNHWNADAGSQEIGRLKFCSSLSWARRGRDPEAAAFAAPVVNFRDN
jgi:hypothetical protein